MMSNNLLEDQIKKYSQGIKTLPSIFETTSAVEGWQYILRGVEEFINMPHEDAAVLEQSFWETSLSDFSKNLLLINQAMMKVQKRFDRDVGHRFRFILLLFTNFRDSLLAAGRNDAAEMLSTASGLLCFLRSRRRHMVAVFYLLPEVCHGEKKFNPNEDAARLLQAVEHGIDLTGLYQKAMLAEVFSDYNLTIKNGKIIGNYDYQPLDEFFLDAERTSVVEMGELERKVIGSLNLERQNFRNIFSQAELRNHIKILAAAYAEFNLDDTLFGVMRKVIYEILSLNRDDYHVRLHVSQLIEILDKHSVPQSLRENFLHSSGGYEKCINEYAPFVKVGENFISTIPLILRHCNQLKNIILNKNRRYQIRSGFIFEEKVKKSLMNQGFLVKDIRRINRKEFDVISVRDGVIFNIQCKNNLIDQSQIESERRAFARYNRRLNSYYEKALKKEEERSDLLRKELGLSEVRNFLVSAFPVVTKNPKIISFLKIDIFSSLVKKFP